MHPGVRPGRTVGATVLGGIVGMAVGIAAANWVIGPTVGFQGLAALLPVLWSAIVGIVLGAGIALVVAFRDEPVRTRAITAGPVVVVGLVLFVAALGDVVDVMVAHPLTLAIALPVVALLGRRLAVRTRGRDAADTSQRRGARS